MLKNHLPQSLETQITETSGARVQTGQLYAFNPSGTCKRSTEYSHSQFDPGQEKQKYNQATDQDSALCTFCLPKHQFA